MRIDPALYDLAQAVNDALRAAGATLATAESCTGGLIAGAITAVPGSSDILYGGFVTYSNAAKTAMIGVPEDLIAHHGAVSPEVARAMAEGARRTAQTDFAIAVTGVAGPGGGSLEKPVGLVHFGFASATATVHEQRRFGDIGRDRVRAETVRVALRMVLEAMA
ncbi:CinA family protein [Pelagibacterium xiamenense]|uniref:CinA family protein n=1 Tax=Pelagibacterium xiamenense TaxID=2901140 RepID=UPI001E326D93|nr:CinA family protein [Pelagibacterium xiamenense]MCD7060992.1 CinA family protein [Pelagibacterium xiamenense]